jgi:hypothetical protein
MTQTTQAPIQDIETSETDASQKIANVKKESAKEVEAFKISEEKRKEDRKSEIKQEAQSNLKEEEKKLHAILKDGGEETKGQKDALSEHCKKNEASITAKLADQFLSLSP